MFLLCTTFLLHVLNILQLKRVPQHYKNQLKLSESGTEVTASTKLWLRTPRQVDSWLNYSSCVSQSERSLSGCFNRSDFAFFSNQPATLATTKRKSHWQKYRSLTTFRRFQQLLNESFVSWTAEWPAMTRCIADRAEPRELHTEQEPSKLSLASVGRLPASTKKNCIIELFSVRLYPLPHFHSHNCPGDSLHIPTSM